MTERRQARIEEILKRKQPDLRLFLDDVSSSQNHSAILRSCDAVGVLGLYYAVRSDTAFKTHPTITQGAEKWVRSRRIPYRNRIAFLEEKRKDGFALAVTYFDESAVSFRNFDFTRPTIIVVGNEKEGVSEEVAALADTKIVIPMMGMAQSLNVSVATAVILYEAQRQREAAGMYDTPQLSVEQMHEIAAAWRYRDEVASRSKGAIAFSGKMWLDW